MRTDSEVQCDIHAALDDLVTSGMAYVMVDADGERKVVADFHLAGFRYHDGPDIMPYLQPGEPLALIAEPGNHHDEWAVRVEHRKSRIGYIPRGINRRISLLLQAGFPSQARIVEINPNVAPWECVRMQLSFDCC